MRGSKPGRVLVIAVLLLVASVASAANPGPYDLSWWTVDSSGGSSSGGDYALTGTLGQAEAGTTSSGSEYTVAGGFWGAGGGGVEHDVYLPVVLRTSP
jgi:hypothetical protein